MTGSDGRRRGSELQDTLVVLAICIGGSGVGRVGWALGPIDPAPSGECGLTVRLTRRSLRSSARLLLTEGFGGGRLPGSLDPRASDLWIAGNPPPRRK